MNERMNKAMVHQH